MPVPSLGSQPLPAQNSLPVPSQGSQPLPAQNSVSTTRQASQPLPAQNSLLTSRQVTLCTLPTNTITLVSYKPLASILTSESFATTTTSNILISNPGCNGGQTMTMGGWLQGALETMDTRYGRRGKAIGKVVGER